MPARNLNTLIADAARKLEAVGIESGAAEAEYILCELLDFDRLHLYLHGPSLIDDDLIERFDAVVTKRLTRYPLQYILGVAWFFGRKFIVNEAVMVPTPETELLLDSLLRAARRCRSHPVSVLDVGVGSGVLSVSAALENPELDITALDISEAALGVARQNAERLEAVERIGFIQSDLFAGLKPGQQFDIIASNPPYIADGEYAGLPPEVKADPRISLLGGPKGMDIIDRLIKEGPEYLKRPGYLMFEIGYDQAEDVFASVQADSHYVDCTLLKDLNDIDRVIIGRVE
ncbi:MAG: peptide chain release factor N(5)-glutamine methyltransferase [candidate division Zixibacteria bacterium]|nr:peptide chain release factor N(5)-glutamine methyltransferase [candidate division Zixibacteria bacterium]